MANELQQALARIAIHRHPDMARAVRELRERGAYKSDVVKVITRKCRDNRFMRALMLILVDEVWQEP